MFSGVPPIATDARLEADVLFPAIQDFSESRPVA
jgi:hypothetical protein